MTCSIENSSVEPFIGLFGGLSPRRLARDAENIGAIMMFPIYLLPQ